MKNKKIIKALFLVLFIILIIISSLIRKGLNKEEIKSNEEVLEEVELLEIEENVNYKNDIIGSLSIEKIDLKADIKEGSNWYVLKENIGHIEETSLFDGNVGLASHNRGNFGAYFERIDELEKGDKITYDTNFGTREYHVISKEIIEETDWSKLKNTKENKLTLITCVKDEKEKRLCVQAIEV